MFRYPEHLGRPFLWAHRGASASAPDNTITSFLLAADQDADGVELDVHRTRDGVAAVTHDRSISPVTWRLQEDRGRSAEVCVPADAACLAHVRLAMTADSGALRLSVHEPAAARVPVADMDWSDLHTLVCGYDAEGRPLHVPRLEEVFEALPVSMALDIEIKSAPHPFPDLEYPGLSDDVAAIVRRYHAEDRVLVSSFDHRLLRRLAAKAPDIGTLAIYHARVVDAVGLARAVPTANVNMEFGYSTEEDIRACHEAGLSVSVGGLGSAADLARAARWHADAVTLDDPRWCEEAGLAARASHRAP